MTESLGESQVVQYLLELSKKNSIYLLSFEKPVDEVKYQEMKSRLKNANISWRYFTYSNKFGVLSTAWQITQAIFLLSNIVQKNKIDIVHTRSLVPAVIGMILKKISGVKLLFDIRGFAIDEKIVDGRLKENSFLTRWLKKIERVVYRNSDHIVTLTHASKPIIVERYNIKSDNITVIPTCANKELFSPVSADEKLKLRQKYSYSDEDVIILHSGSVNNWVDFDAEITLFKHISLQNNNTKFIILNKGQHALIDTYVEKYQLEKTRYRILSAEFSEMKEYLNIADLCVFFIKPSFAKLASAPTKFAELVACNLPSVTNTQYGDMEYYLSSYQVGMLLELQEVHRYPETIAAKVIDYVSANIHQFNKNEFDKCFMNHFSRGLAVERYNNIYGQLCGDTT